MHRTLIAAVVALLVAGCQPELPAQAEPRPMQPKPEYAIAWEYVTACAGVVADSQATLAQVKWFERDSTQDSAGNLIIGEWVEPDSVIIAVGYADSLWVIAHELLHHRIGRYNVPSEPHPWIPFAFPCKLMEFQQTAGGIMQPAAHRGSP